MSHTPRSNQETTHGSLTSDPSLTTFVGFPLVLVALLLAVSNPLVAATVAATVALAAKSLQVGLSAYVRRTGDRIRALDVPGVGTVEFRVIPQ